MPKIRLKTSELRAFEKGFNTIMEDSALQARGEFLRRFPLSKLKNLSLDNYVIGSGTDSFWRVWGHR